MATIVRCLLPALVFALSACAIADLPNATQSPPITLAPAPSPVFTGNCNETHDLEQWAQGAYFLTLDFTNAVNAAAEQNRNEIHDEVLRMAEVRDTMTTRQTPDCAVEAQTVLLDVMDDAVLTFQSYANGDLENLGNSVAELNARLDQAVALQNELVVRLDRQLRSPSGAG